MHQLLASYLTVWGEGRGGGGKSNNKRETPQPRIRSLRGRAAWVDMLCLLPGTDNEALSRSCHSSEPSMKKERPMPTAQYQTHAGGREWAEQRNGNLWKKETCEEGEFLRIIVPLEKPQSTNTVWSVGNHQRGPSGLTGTHRAPAFGMTRLPPSSHLPRHSSQPGFWGRTEGSRACGGPFPRARPRTPRPAAPRNRTLQPANPQPLQLAS